MPIAPLLMTPYYRHGSQTPWGGDSLKVKFGKDIPDDRTGESLEASAIPGMESTAQDGRKLSEWIAEYGEALTGEGMAAPFPLLLKILDARDTLSVQVHPDDAFAAENEGKLGKTEAWHILWAEEGAELIYGVQEGVTREELRRACENGSEIEKYLRHVPVRAGETYYIPAGMVHAIGHGIMLYEIQQSSDVTYRFYDWERVGKDGKKRELHIEKAVAVTDLTAQKNCVEERPVAPGRYLLLREKYFTLERFEDYYGMPETDHRCFAFLTALGPTTLQWQNGKMALNAGQTVLLPADGYDFVLDTPAALLAYPTLNAD